MEFYTNLFVYNFLLNYGPRKYLHYLKEILVLLFDTL